MTESIPSNFLCLRQSQIIVHNTMPSKKASYNWLGWRGRFTGPLAGNSIPIGYKLVKMAHTENNLYNAAEDWAEPDVDEAAKALVGLYEDRDKGIRIGAVARDAIFHQYSIANFRQSVLEFLS